MRLLFPEVLRMRFLHGMRIMIFVGDNELCPGFKVPGTDPVFFLKVLGAYLEFFCNSIKTVTFLTV